MRKSDGNSMTTTRLHTGSKGKVRVSALLSCSLGRRDMVNKLADVLGILGAETCP